MCRVTATRKNQDDRQEGGKLDKTHLLGRVAACLAECGGNELRDDAKHEDTGKDRTHDESTLTFVVSAVANLAGCEQNELDEGAAYNGTDGIHKEQCPSPLVAE